MNNGIKIPKAKVLFWPLGNADLETVKQDVARALASLRSANVDVTAIEEIIWWDPKQIPRLARTLGNKEKEFDLVLIFSATHRTVRCISAIGRRFSKLPLVIWAVPERYSLATSGLAASYLRERGHYVKMFNNAADDRSVLPEIETIARAARSYRLSRRMQVGIIGKRSPLMISWPYNLVLLKSKLGPTVHEIPLPKLERALKSVTDAQVEDTLEEYKQKYKVNVSDETLGKAVRFQLAVRKLTEKLKLDAIALECWTNLFLKYGVNPCLGHLDDLIVGCEGDIMSMSGQLILRGINGVNPYLADILSVDTKKNTIELSHCSAPISLASDPSKIEISERTDPGRAGKTAFAHFQIGGGEVTLARFFGRGMDKLHITHGVMRPSDAYWGGISMTIDSEGNSSEFLDTVSGNHYLLTFGDVRKELKLFARWSGLEVIEN